MTVFHQPDRHRYLLSLVNFQKDLPNIPIEGIAVRMRPGEREDCAAWCACPTDEVDRASKQRGGVVTFSAAAAGDAGHVRHGDRCNAESMRDERTRAERPIVGIWQHFPLPMISRYLGQMGWDWVIVDMQHGCPNTETAYECVHTLRTAGATPMLRVSVGVPSRSAAGARSGGRAAWSCRWSTRLAEARPWPRPPSIRRWAAARWAATRPGTMATIIPSGPTHETLLLVQVEHIDAVNAGRSDHGHAGRRRLLHRADGPGAVDGPAAHRTTRTIPTIAPRWPARWPPATRTASWPAATRTRWATSQEKIAAGLRLHHVQVAKPICSCSAGNELCWRELRERTGGNEPRLVSDRGDAR